MGFNEFDFDYRIGGEPWIGLRVSGTVYRADRGGYDCDDMKVELIEILKPMNEQLVNLVSYKWDDIEQQAFDRLLEEARESA